ncbi:hypothetical protein [Chelativorans sp. YIM 93263]|uniref:hypothetical protein n=1 Tax=Chelativorans sp. YIM 93263 TaxID=2906648 RepID=UPI0023795A77|nr:hypothetical protein [Chelativorans sp. YIM 93263]
MSARISKGRFSPEKPASSAETALPTAHAGQDAGKKKLSGAFTAAIGHAPHPGQAQPKSHTGADALKPFSAASEKPPVKNCKPGAPSLPRKGHR